MGITDAFRSRPQPTLTYDETRRLAELEAVVDRATKTWIAIAGALAEIRDSKLYRDQAETFEDYLATRWHASVRRAYQLLRAHAAASSVSTTDPLTEREATTLAAFAPDQRQAALDSADAAGSRLEHLQTLLPKRKRATAKKPRKKPRQIVLRGRGWRIVIERSRDDIDPAAALEQGVKQLAERQRPPAAAA